MTAQGTAPRACHWDVDGLRLAGLEWGPDGGTPILALHGWMDHADSFQRLAPRLTGCHVVALDLSGQGLSAHRARHATYNIWDDLPQIAEVLDQLGWESCVLIGHSRGANIAALFAAAQPERIRALVSLDSLIPVPNDDDTVVNTLRAFVAETRSTMTRPPRTFATREAYVARRIEQGNSPETSETLADRALDIMPEGARLRGDPRLFASSAVKFTQRQLEMILRSITCPVLNIWAENGILNRGQAFAELARLGKTFVPDYESTTVAGDHHFHLSEKSAPLIAGVILDFLNRKLST